MVFVNDDFFIWANKKLQINSTDIEPPFFKDGEIWWCSMGKNIGAEIDGKGNLFARPVLVLRKLSSTVFIAIPLTTKIKIGNWFYIFNHRDRNITANLSQIKMLDYKRMLYRHGEVEKRIFNEIRQQLRRLLKI